MPAFLVSNFKNYLIGTITSKKAVAVLDEMSCKSQAIAGTKVMKPRPTEAVIDCLKLPLLRELPLSSDIVTAVSVEKLRLSFTV